MLYTYTLDTKMTEFNLSAFNSLYVAFGSTNSHRRNLTSNSFAFFRDLPLRIELMELHMHYYFLLFILTSIIHSFTYYDLLKLYL